MMDGHNMTGNGESKKEIDTLRVLLAHWIEHNRSHEENFRSWVEKSKNLGKIEASRMIEKAADALKAASDFLLEAKRHI
ncbi:MAG: hypothetical protein PWP45_674 [Tepidanaerobacteraceae bacterium]|nr:hypothetical protein [Tepidanaerobacteraceae bacterium]